MLEVCRRDFQYSKKDGVALLTRQFGLMQRRFKEQVPNGYYTRSMYNMLPVIAEILPECGVSMRIEVQEQRVLKFIIYSNRAFLTSVKVKDKSMCLNNSELGIKVQVGGKEFVINCCEVTELYAFSSFVTVQQRKANVLEVTYSENKIIKYYIPALCKVVCYEFGFATSLEKLQIEYPLIQEQSTTVLFVTVPDVNMDGSHVTRIQTLLQAELWVLVSCKRLTATRLQCVFKE